MALHPSQQSRQRQLSLKQSAYQALKALLACISIVSVTISDAIAGYVPPVSSYGGPPGSTGTRAYEPPNDSRPSAPASTGTRGLGSCGKESRGKLTALAPVNHIGQTTTTHPTFAWYVPDKDPYNIEFRLHRYDSTGKLLSIGPINTLQSQQGIMHYQLPPNQTGLTVGQNYRWQVTLICNSGSRSKDQILRANVAVVAMPPTLQSALAEKSDRLQRAKLYAKAGFWYDALAEALAAERTRSFAITLLEDLVQLESSTVPDKVKLQHDQLKQVVEIEQR